MTPRNPQPKSPLLACFLMLAALVMTHSFGPGLPSGCLSGSVASQDSPSVLNYPMDLQPIRQLVSLLMSSKASQALSAEKLLEIKDVLDDSAIELMYLGAKEHPTQLELAQRFHDRKQGIRLLAAVGGNRSGKSILCGAMCTARYIRDEAPPGAQVWVIAQTFKKSVEGPQKWLWDWLPKQRFSSTWKPENGFSLHQMVTYLANPDLGAGYITIHFKTEVEALETFESSAVDLVWWDEATKESIFGRLMPRVADRAGRILISTIPSETWLTYRIERANVPGWVFQRLKTHDNRANLPPGEIERMMAGMTPEERRMRIEGEDVCMSGLIVPEFKAAMKPDGHLVKPFKIPGNWPKYVYTDVGFYTASILIAISPDETMYAVDEIYTQGKPVAANAEDILSMCRRHNMAVEPGLFFIDPAADAFTAASEVNIGDQYRRAGIPVVGWTRTRTYGEQAMINSMRERLAAGKLFVSQWCENLARELNTWRYKLDQQQRVDSRQIADIGDNHAIDCLKAAACSGATFAGFNEQFKVIYT